MQSLRIALALALVPAACAPPMALPMSGRQPGHSSAATAAHARPDAPRLKRLKNGHYRVTAPWTVVLEGTEWHVQKGYASNGITGPDSMKHSLGDGVKEPETWAAVFHDWLYTQPGMTRAKADRLFYELLLAYGVSPLKSRLMYSGVAAYSKSKAVR